MRFVGCVLHLALPMVIHSEYRTKYPRTFEPMYSVHVSGSCGVPGLEGMGTWFLLTPNALDGERWRSVDIVSYSKLCYLNSCQSESDNLECTDPVK